MYVIPWVTCTTCMYSSCCISIPLRLYVTSMHNIKGFMEIHVHVHVQRKTMKRLLLLLEYEVIPTLNFGHSNSSQSIRGSVHVYIYIHVRIINLISNVISNINLLLPTLLAGSRGEVSQCPPVYRAAANSLPHTLPPTLTSVEPAGPA